MSSGVYDRRRPTGRRVPWPASRHRGQGYGWRMRRRGTNRHARRAPAPIALVVVAASSLASCGGDSGPEAAPTTTAPTGIDADACLVWVHGRGGTGGDPVERDGYAELAPIGNGTWDEGYVWLYDSEERYADARGRIVDAVDAAGCDRIVLDGFSNGAAFAGHLLCRGEDLGGRLRGVVVDDPVPDEGTVGCTPAPGVRVAVYWTGALAEATAGRSCDDVGYTCRGDELVGIDAYAASMGAEVQASPHAEHVWHREAPEATAWLDGR